MGAKLRPEGLDLLLICLSRQDGQVLWQHTLARGNAHYGKQNLSSPSPVTDGRHVWALTGTGVITALTVEGKQVWQRDLQAEFGRFGLLWGYASSPMLLEGRLVVEVLHGTETDAPSYLLALEPISGKTLWKVERPTDAQLESPDAYTTPVPLRQAGRTRFVVSGGDYITAHDITDGREVWRCGGLNPGGSDRYRCVSSPLVVGSMVFASVREGPLVACRTGGTGLVTETHLAWTHPIAPDVPTPVSDGKLLYVLQDKGFLSCLDIETGKAVYEKQRLPRGTYSASPLLADGKLYVTSEDARTTVLAAGPEFRIISENELDGGYTLSSIAVADRELFIRTAGYLYCIAEPPASSPAP
jgi:outer membrane protein assembly factor BamB